MAAVQKSLRAIFDEASDLEVGAKRQAFLDEACNGDATLRANVEELLRAQETAGGFLADPKRRADAANASVAEREGDRIGRYKLLQKIGEGGCGVVYMAEQIEPVRRRVALKIIKLGMDTRSVIARFEAERQAVALMDHPSIAQVLDAGATDTGRPFFVMELVRGTRITEFCEQNNLSTSERLKLFIQVCQAVQHAHQKGIIHRDLKPSNVLVTSNDGVLLPKVIDFGIAKATADVQLTDKTLFTCFEMFIGTPAYMSPEQAEFNARDVDTRTDIYSLGVLLYELLTGYTPFDSEKWLKSGIDAMRKAIRETEPTRPSTRLTRELVGVRPSSGTESSNSPASSSASPSPDATVPENRLTSLNRDQARASSHRVLRMKETIAQLRGDLDWIVLKALEKDRARRYQAAADFAADIQRHLADEPVVACPPSRLYLLKKLIRRNRPAFAAASAVALLLVSAVIFGAWDIARTRSAERSQRELRRQAEQARGESDAANRRLTRTLFLREWQDAEALLDQGKIASALAWFARAAREHPSDFAVQTRLMSILTENTFAMPLGRPFAHGTLVISGAFSADERQLVTAAGDGQVRIWPLDSEAVPLVLPRHFSSPGFAATVVSGNRVLVDDSESVSLWEMSGAEVKTVRMRHLVTGPVRITPDGRFAALNCGEGGPQVWDTLELRPVGRPMRELFQDGPVGIDPAGRYLFALRTGGWLSAWDVSSGRRVWEVEQPRASISWIGMAIAPDTGRVVLSRPVGVANGELSEWKFEPEMNPEIANRKYTSPDSVLPMRSRVMELAFSRTGDRLFTADLEGHFGTVQFATREWRMFNGEHDGRITWLGLSADGQRLATTSVDGTARLWDVRMKSPEPRLYTNGYTIWSATFSPDSRWFVLAGNQALEIRDTASGALRHRLPMNELVTHVDISPDGRRVVAGGSVGATRVWDAQTGQPVTPVLPGPPNHYVEFSHNGRWFVVVTSGSTTTVYETETGQLVSPRRMMTSGVHAHFSPDDRFLIITTEHGDIEFWSLPEGRRLKKTLRHKDVIWTAQFSPDGTKLVTASRDRTAALWDLESGRLLREFRHDQQVYRAAFSPDGRRILTGDANHLAHVWDVETGRRLFMLLPHPGAVWHGEFSHDGRVMITGDDAGNARLWEASTGLPLSGWVRNGSSLKRARFSPDGRYALSAADGGTVRVWPILLCPLPAPSWLPELAEAVAGRRLREDGVPESVPVEHWQTLSATLGSLTGNDFYSRWARWFLVERMKPNPASFTP